MISDECTARRCACRTRPGLLVAASAEVDALCPHRLPLEPVPAEIHRLLVGNTYNLTPAAASHASLSPRGGAPASLVALLAAGQLLLIDGHPPAPSLGGLRTAQQPDEPLVPPTPGPATEKAWINFRVVDDESGDPIPGVALLVRLPNGMEREFTTRPDGMVEIHEIDPGTCDILKMTDDEGYEVVAVESK